MAITPSQLHAPWSRPQQTQLAGRDFIRVRTLYLGRRYKQCISVCEDLIQPDLHPVHEAFRLFHQAISYEALGLAAHNYSRNKIPYLDSAKDKFAAALDALPQPFATDEVGRYDMPKPSPLVLDFSSARKLDEAREDSPDIGIVPTIQVSNRTRTPSEASSHCSSSTTSSVSDTYTVPDFDRYSPRPDLLAAPSLIPRTVTFPDVQKKDQEWNDTEQREPKEDAPEGDETESEDDTDPTPRKPSYQFRLSTCLSSTHVLADDLVPSPLFSRTKKTAQITYPAATEDTNREDNESLTTPQPPRPLPRTPYTHRTHHTLLPARRTAVQTLISKFEQTLPSPNTPSSYTTASPPTSAATRDTQPPDTAATARFAAIASIFAPHPPSAVSGSPAQAHHLTISQYLSSHALARYNKSLSSFRSSLLFSISRTETAIHEAHEIQERHVREKQEAAISDAQNSRGMGQVRLRSYWFLSTPTTSSPPAPKLTTVRKVDTTTAGRGRLTIDTKRLAERSDSPFASTVPASTETPTPATRVAPAPLPTPPTTPAEPSSIITPPPGTTSTHTRFIDRLPSLRIQEDETKKSQRLDKLRACGFTVRKETYGWKGARYYEEVRRRVEGELGVPIQAA